MTEDEFLAVLKLIDPTARIVYSSAGAAGVVIGCVKDGNQRTRLYAHMGRREDCVQELMKQFEQGGWDDARGIRGRVGPRK